MQREEDMTRETHPTTPTATDLNDTAELFVEVPPEDLLPTMDDLLRNLAVANEERLSEEALEALAAALDEAAQSAHPKMLIQEVEEEALNGLFWTPGLHQSPSPLEQVFRGATRFALYAATLGQEICSRIRRHFEAGDYPRGFFLDAIASSMADASGGKAVSLFSQRLKPQSAENPVAVLGYSPGYCGWKLEAQRRLFLLLRPQRIGIRLNESCLMDPIKSVTGVLAAGPPKIHYFDANFDFCSDCRTKSCLRRIRALRRQYAS